MKSSVVIRLEIDSDPAVDAHQVVEEYLEAGFMQEALNEHQLPQGRLRVVACMAVNPSSDEERLESALDLAASLPHYAVPGLLSRLVVELRDRSWREGFTTRALESALDLAETSARAADSVLAVTAHDCA